MNSTAQNTLEDTLIVRTLIGADYEITHSEMLQKTLARIDKKKQGITTPDELWIVEHNDVYTLGQAGKKEHILQQTNTPIIQTDRGGQVTWHGMGQLVIYWLIDLNTLGWSVRDLVSHAEQSIEDVLNRTLQSHPDANGHTFYAKARQDAPGVYIYNQDDLMLGKIASLGFKIKHGFSYHGIALNLTCDLNAFNAINPCGYAGMQMLRLADFVSLDKVSPESADETSNDLQPNPSQKVDIVAGSITELQTTHDLLHNIMQREAGNITLRRSPDSKR
ncbi:lipoyl(octanoyl) transferase LipB [Psychrobacter sp. FDAARGOS_221]|uniref:lipoyl(octanoyl) transferase LipB n=1 Tax=Psychrobacter sp. FDAARGOS_221 TaxID=1975705 RepID=UPI000BB53D26|nr:lipoyl(octanoyl) transferase LipB [Psychrobacter sp. FDAARGOS_221]PNK59791.1 lipoyl(octanoyl) transferase [Psychrobacter sp. FDAARGOS_221]